MYDMDSEYRKFVAIANPHSWFLAADNLHAQAITLHGSRGKSVLYQLDGDDRLIGKWDDVNKSVFLLGGFALENMLKGFLVYENPNWISNGVLSRQLKTHSLTTLRKKSDLAPFRNKYQWVLCGYEQGLESWARYPCALSLADSELEANMTTSLWDGYIKLMAAYSKAIRRLLSKGWKGPHGFEGRWMFKDWK
jgi:hypothetical protein